MKAMLCGLTAKTIFRLRKPGNQYNSPRSLFAHSVLRKAISVDANHSSAFTASLFLALVRFFDPFIPNTFYSYSLKQKIGADLDNEQLALS